MLVFSIIYSTTTMDRNVISNSMSHLFIDIYYKNEGVFSQVHVYCRHTYTCIITYTHLHTITTSKYIYILVHMIIHILYTYI